MRRLARFIVAASTAFALVCVILGIAYAIEHRECVHLYTFEVPFKFSIAFAVIVGIATAAYPRRQDSSEQNAFATIVAGAAIGCFYWYFSQRVWALQFGRPWQWELWQAPVDYELRAALCWIAAGASAVLITVIRRPRTVVITTTVFCLLAVVLPTPIFNYLTDNRELTVAVATPADKSEIDSSDALACNAREFDPSKVGAHVLEVLHQSGLQGNYRISDFYRIGAGKKTLQIIVVNTPVAKHAQLPQPDVGEVMYVQRADGWQEIPTQAPTLERSIEIWGDGKSQDSIAMILVPDAAGMGVGFGVYTHRRDK